MSKIHPPKVTDPQRTEPPIGSADDGWDQLLTGEIGLTRCVRTGTSEYFCQATEQLERTYHVVWTGAAVLLDPSDAAQCLVTRAGKRFAPNCTEVQLGHASRRALATARQRSDFYFQSALRVLRWAQQHGDYQVERRSQDPAAQNDAYYLVSDSGNGVSFVLHKATRGGKLSYQLKMGGIETFLPAPHGLALERQLKKTFPIL